MEHAIGTRITLPDGRKAEVVAGVLCSKCIFFPTRKPQKAFCDAVNNHLVKCAAMSREDCRHVYFKEVR